ncbi:aspartate aminotransferase family protein [bacterium]|nr:aspartate aminotransferase family protein [bacterium]
MDNRQQYVDPDLGFYARRALTISHGRGARLWDADGKMYIDCIAGMGVAALGHGHVVVAEAIARQAEKMITCSNFFSHEPGTLLMEKLIEISPPGLERVFFCNSGAEAMEAAIKLARLSTGRTELIAAEGAFHGRTLGALSATHREKYRIPFMPLVPGFTHVPFNDIAALEESVTENTAGIMLEVVQGEGGIHPADLQYLQKVRALCDKRGIILIFDEVQSGFCRTGRWFACDHYDVAPDILAVAKAMAGGLPMGAVICSDKVQAEPGLHGTTFGGNPLCAAAGVAAIRIMEDQHLCKRAADLGDWFVAELKKLNLPSIVEIRHMGLMIGIELDLPVGEIIIRFQDKGVLIFGAGERVLRLLPPLIIEKDELKLVLKTFKAVLSTIK